MKFNLFRNTITFRYIKIERDNIFLPEDRNLWFNTARITFDFDPPSDYNTVRFSIDPRICRLHIQCAKAYYQFSVGIDNSVWKDLVQIKEQKS